MPRFTLRGLTLDVPEAALRGTLPEALTSGRYEGQEADAVLRHLRAGDRFLDLGAGLGFLCALAAREIGADRVTGVEAGPETARMARANLALNGFGAVDLHHGAVVPPGHEGRTVAFGQRPAFWASALQAGGDWPKNAEIVEVPAIQLSVLMETARPTILSCDIEGAEADVLDQPLPENLRLIVAEIHPSVYGAEGTRRLFQALAAQGFAYCPDGSRGATVVLVRA
jgi:FkbM family methyltransferase